MNKGLTMVELIVVIGIVGFALVGLLISYVSSLNLSEFDRNLTIAMNIAREKMEELYNARDLDFANLGAGMCESQPGACNVIINGNDKIVSFDFQNLLANHPGFNGSCTIYIKDKGSANGPVPLGQIKEARVIVCWRQHLGNIIGEDTNLNGILDPLEDIAGSRHTDELDSPCELISAFSKR